MTAVAALFQVWLIKVLIASLMTLMVYSFSVPLVSVSPEQGLAVGSCLGKDCSYQTVYA